MKRRANHLGAAATLGTAVLVLTISAFAVMRAVPADSEVKVTIDRNIGPQATKEFKFADVPSPMKDDAGATATLVMVDGEADGNGGDLGALTDGLLPKYEDDPSANFFLTAGTTSGRFRMDLGSAIEIGAVNSYSWHPQSRGPQVYALYGSDGTGANFNPAPKGNVDPAAAGWKWIATVDTRLQQGDNGGQYGVSNTNAKGTLGKYRYLLFVCYATEVDDDWGNTFFSEIDVVGKK